MKIHPTAVVDPTAQLGHDVELGPFCVVGPEVAIGDGCRIEARVVIRSHTRLGAQNRVHEGAVLGGPPQHVACPDEIGRLEIGSHNTIREFATLHAALKPDAITRVGDHNLLMVGTHVGHDCVVGNHTIITNNVLLGGHVLVEDRAFISGAVGIHQFCRIGSLAMVGGLARVIQDVPPFVTVDGQTGRIVGLNSIGLRRAGLSNEDRRQLKAAYKIVYRSGMRWEEILERLAAEFQSGPAYQLLTFLRGGKRGFVNERRTPPAATVKLHAEDDDDAPSLRVKAG